MAGTGRLQEASPSSCKGDSSAAVRRLESPLTRRARLTGPYRNRSRFAKLGDIHLKAGVTGINFPAVTNAAGSPAYVIPPNDVNLNSLAAGADISRCWNQPIFDCYLRFLIWSNSVSIRNLDKIFEPHRIAVIGATDTPTSVGYTVLRNLVGSGFRGVVYPVNSKREAVQGIQAYKDIPSLPHPPDLAVICTPAATVAAIVRQCGEAGTRGVVIISAGFREIGAEGASSKNLSGRSSGSSTA